MKLKALLTPRLIAAAIVFFPIAAHADQWDKKTVLTINEKLQVRDRVLEPGTYVFKLLNSNSDRHVVQIFNADQSHIIDTVLAIPDYRLEPTGRSQFKFWETPSGYVKALKAWYYPGDNFGQEFTYPKHPAMLEMAALITPPTPAPAPQPYVEQEAAVVTPQPEPAPQEQAPPVEMAQNAPPAEPVAPEAQNTPTNTLPKTGSPYPLVGLAGLLFVGAFGALRLKRTA